MNLPSPLELQLLDNADWDDFTAANSAHDLTMQFWIIFGFTLFSVAAMIVIGFFAHQTFAGVLLSLLILIPGGIGLFFGGTDMVSERKAADRYQRELPVWKAEAAETEALLKAHFGDALSYVDDNDPPGELTYMRLSDFAHAPGDSLADNDRGETELANITDWKAGRHCSLFAKEIGKKDHTVTVRVRIGCIPPGDK